ncbi:NADP-dependent oxidoreductase domain-containing protein [Lasiosphaeris hirsuta]|uniref:NADP-dependent oxidoreductase domain-containing protein n=1 Tax=Lasiosphaeris hirsuta TaxID=260670 RepID=A0AA39ZWN6_9PEZI|nr:NADP-dependent oxidoreductase domain-containing protein [Lasiosphaeris hirsuta]
MSTTGNPTQPEAIPAKTAEMPVMLYGTAWKKERTADLVYDAIKAGFRGIDTAAMKRHYDEALTGEGIQRAIADGLVTRSELWIQTKFTPGDEAYADRARYPTIPSQILASLTTSLTNLSTPYLDALILHSPFPTPAATALAWSTLQTLTPSPILQLGISNAALTHLVPLSPPPAIIQNRFHAATVFDVAIRRWIAAPDDTSTTTTYQGFWTLTGNRGVWTTPTPGGFVERVSQGAGVEPATAWYALLVAEGVVVLNGTTDPLGRGREDLEGLENVAAWRETEEGREVWEGCLGEFRGFVGAV